MTNLERIQQAEGRVGQLQDRLDDVQVVLHKAEQLAEAGEAAKRRARPILLAFVAAVAVAIVVAVIVNRRRSTGPGETDDDRDAG